MSRSNHVELQNPATKFFEWAGGQGKGYFGHYDKESKQTIKAPMPFKFIVLDQLHNVRGWSDADESGYWSNEVRNLKTDIITIRTKKGVAGIGTYEELQRDPDLRGARYCQSVYIAYKEGEKFVLANIQMIGSCVSAWFDFTKKNSARLYKEGVVVKGSIQGKKGATVFEIPTFEFVSVKEEINQIANNLDTELQTYLSAYLAKTQNEASSEIGLRQERGFAPADSQKSELDNLFASDAIGVESILPEPKDGWKSNPTPNIEDEF